MKVYFFSESNMQYLHKQLTNLKMPCLHYCFFKKGLLQVFTSYMFHFPNHATCNSCFARLAWYTPKLIKLLQLCNIFIFEYCTNEMQ